MRRHRPLTSVVALGIAVALSGQDTFARSSPDGAEETGTVKGTVTLDTTGDPIHGAEVSIIGRGETVFADSAGRFELENVPVGTHEIMAFRQHLIAARLTINVEAGRVTEVGIAMTLTPVHESIVVTASAGPTTTFEAFNAVTSLDSMEIAEKMAGNIGEVLEEEPGIYKRSFGPGSSRPVIRGFDGDRVLIMQDGIRTGDLSSQSGDHGVTLDPAGLERLEVVRGPATLLYGSNAIGGVVNAITPHDTFYKSRHVGTNGQVVTDLGSANAQAGVNGSIQYTREDWTIWAGGGARRTDDYDTPEGKVENSKTRLSNGRAGLGYYKDKTFLSLGYQIEDARHGVPGIGELHGEEEDGLQIDLDSRRQSARFDVGMRNLSNNIVDSFRMIFNYLDWHHDELETDEGREEVGTTFDNQTYVARAEFEQKKADRWSGKFGIWTQYRDYISIGEEALAPPTTQKAFAGFAYEEVELSPATRLQFGGRLEYNDYDPEERLVEQGEEELEPPEVRPRSFVGFSGSAGLRYSVGSNSVLVANFTRSSRAPALEELYNFGPHVGNLAFEIGNPDLEKETTLGAELSLRTKSPRFSGGLNIYYYDIKNFVFPSFTDRIQDGLRVAPFLKGDSRFVGLDGEGSFEIHEHALLNVGVGYVSAKLTETDEFLPRIPPLHGRISIEIPYRALTVWTELVWAAKQDNVFRDESPTEGYRVLNINGSYLLARQNLAHVLAVKAYNLTDELYRIHTSFIKDIAPEMGRGIKFTYSIRFF